jgi:hypothetical protein
MRTKARSMDTDCSLVEPLAKRVAYYKRIFAHGVGKTPTSIQKIAIARAAVLTAKAELAALDPATSANDTVRLDGVAAKARRDMAAVLKIAAKTTPRYETLDELLETSR